MAQLIDVKHRPKSTDRFTLITSHYQTIYLRDEFTEKEFQIECESRRERAIMACNNDTQWMEWLDSNGAYK